MKLTRREFLEAGGSAVLISMLGSATNMTEVFSIGKTKHKYATLLSAKESLYVITLLIVAERDALTEIQVETPLNKLRLSNPFVQAGQTQTFMSAKLFLEKGDKLNVKSNKAGVSFVTVYADEKGDMHRVIKSIV